MPATESEGSRSEFRIDFPRNESLSASGADEVRADSIAFHDDGDATAKTIFEGFSMSFDRSALDNRARLTRQSCDDAETVRNQIGYVQRS